jgi:hypothetical protein
MKDALGHGSDSRGGPAAHQTGVNKIPNGQNVRELTLFAQNDGDLYRQSQQPIEANLSKKVANGSYDHDKAVKAWGYHADRAAVAYGKQFGGNGKQMFSPADRRAAAQHFADVFRNEHVKK